MANAKRSTAMVTTLALIAWAVYTFIYLALKDSPATANAAGYMVLLGEAGLDLFAAMLAYRLWQQSTHDYQKHIFLLFTFAFSVAVMVDSTYNILLNLSHYTYDQPLAISLFEVPFLVFLFLQMLAWMSIIHANRESNTSVLLYIPYIIIGSMILTLFMYLIEWEIEYLSLIGVYQTLDTALEVLGFTMATICFSRAKNSLMKFSSFGFMMIVVSDFIIRYHVVNGITPYLNHFEMTWILGLTLVCLGFSIHKGKDKENILKLASISSVQSQVTAWIFVVMLLAALVRHLFY